MQLQDKDQTITTLKSENDSLTSSLNAAETRLTELYADQGRMEEEMAARIEVAEKLRTQVRELEKEKRDIQRRYNEQVHFVLRATFSFAHHLHRHPLLKQNVKHFMITNNISNHESSRSLRLASNLSLFPLHLP